MDTKYKVDRDIDLKDYRHPFKKRGYPVWVPGWYTRFFEKVPGVITWLLILAPVVLSITDQFELLIVYVALITAYWSYRGFKFAYGIVVGYKRMKRDIQIDWVKELSNLNSKKDVKYVYICPVVKEGMEILDPAIKLFSEQDIGSDKISIVFTLEEKFADLSVPICEKLIKNYAHKFREMYYDIHPAGIPGEIRGVKGANINWATRRFVKKVEERGEDLDNYLLITNDCDLRPHRKYLSAITYKFLTAEDRHKKFFASAVHTFNNNIWDVPVLNRVFANSLTLAILHSWVVEPIMRDTWSAYVVSLKTVKDVGYWHADVGIDDTTFYWEAVLKFNGDFKGEEVYIPTYNDAVEHETYWKSHQALYKQQLRWGWGIIVFPMAFAGFYKNKRIKTLKKADLVRRLVHNQIAFTTAIYTITFSVPIMHLISNEFQYSSASYNLTKAMSYVLTALMTLNIPVYLVKIKLIKRPANWTLFRKFLDMVEIPLITVNMLTFGFFPKIQAQTEMLLNRFRGEYYATEKGGTRV